MYEYFDLNMSVLIRGCEWDKGITESTNMASSQILRIKPLVWKRFIHDIFMVWTHGEGSLNHFIEYLISLHESIKFTHEFSYSDINFLDTTVKFNVNRELITTLYNKPTDTHLYLEYSSAHPSNVLEKGPIDNT